MIDIKVNKGSVKWMPEGSKKDAPSSVLKEGDVVHCQVIGAAEVADTPEADGKLRALMKAQMEKDTAAPALGSAATIKDPSAPAGEFVISTDAVPVAVRVYYENAWREVIVRKGTPLQLATTNSNAVTAALYGVEAAP